MSGSELHNQTTAVTGCRKKCKSTLGCNDLTTTDNVHSTKNMTLSVSQSSENLDDATSC